MNIKYRIALTVLIIIEVILLFTLVIGDNNIALFQTKGAIATQQRDLMLTAVGIMLIIVIPVLFFLGYFAWKYREDNTKVSRKVTRKTTLKSELLMWIAPSIIIAILAILNWKSTHTLDPYRQIDHHVKPLNVQVVALQWKWLFIYPEQGIATVNYVQFPEDTPITFHLTADGPMSSFWIPNLGGQMYAMTGMSTKLNLIADEMGEFPGSSAEISGKGFAGMKFIAKSSSQSEFDSWVQTVKSQTKVLDMDSYTQLALPSENSPVSLYSSIENNLYNKIMAKFMVPTEINNGTSHHE